MSASTLPVVSQRGDEAAITGRLMSWRVMRQWPLPVGSTVKFTASKPAAQLGHLGVVAHGSITPASDEQPPAADRAGHAPAVEAAALLVDDLAAFSLSGPRLRERAAFDHLFGERFVVRLANRLRWPG
jgi:hypothetical protein